MSRLLKQLALAKLTAKERAQPILGDNSTRKAGYLTSSEIVPGYYRTATRRWYYFLQQRIRSAVEGNERGTIAKARASRPEFIAKICLLTAGDWIRLTSLTTDFTREIDTQNRNPRLFSEEIANRVFARRMNILRMLAVQ